MSKRGRPTKAQYPMGSVSSGTMRAEDLIPTLSAELEGLARQAGIVDAKTRCAHRKLVKDIEARIESNVRDVDSAEVEEDYWDSESAGCDIGLLFEALGCYSAPYFYFGAHPGDGADYGWWLGEGWDEDFETAGEWVRHTRNEQGKDVGCTCSNTMWRIKVGDLADVPKGYRGEVAEVNDHGNVTLWVKGARGMKEIWSVV